MAIATSKKKKPIVRRQKSLGGEPKWDDWEKMTPQEYSRHIHTCSDYYRLEKKPADFKKYVIEYCKKTDTWTDYVTKFEKIPDNRFNCTIGGLCKQFLLGRPNIHKGYNKYWEELPGTMGTPRPLIDSIDKFIEDLKYKADALVDAEQEKKKEEAVKGEVYKPTIQERIFEQCVHMDEKVGIWLDSWFDDSLSFNPKGFDFKKHFYEVQITQAHARKLKSFYEGEVAELEEVITPPKLPKNATELEKDYAQQLKDGYSIYKKNDVKKKLQALSLYMGALDVIIDTAKAKRKPRKVVPKSKEKLIAKLKFAVNDDKFQLASVNPTEIIGCNELWVFNIKTRKLGKYVASVIDPLGTERPGSGLSVKGTTIIGFNEEKSIQKTLRKPEEKLAEFKSCGKRKLEKFLDTINAVDIKLNGRLNADTILLKAVR